MDSPGTAVDLDHPEAPPAKPERATGRTDLRWILALGGLFLLATLVMALPSVRLWTTHIPGNHGDAFLQQWLLQWDMHGLLDRQASIFHPNIYWPNKNVLFYSDTQLAAAPVVGAVALAVGWPIAYNIVYVAGWTASLAATYALTRWLGASRAAAILASFIFTFAAVRLGHSGHFQLLSLLFVPLALLLLLRFLEDRRWWQAVALGVVMAATFLNVAYIALVLVPAVAVVAGGWLIVTRFRPGRRFVTGLLAAGAVALALTAPVLAGYRSQADVISPEYAPEQAVVPSDFLAPADGSLLYGWLFRAVDAPYENRLFPGLLAIVLGAIGVVALWRGGNERVRRREVLLVLLATVPALLFAFGKYQTIGGWRLPLPYSWFADLAGFRSIRAFGRFTAVPLLGLAVLAALGFDRLSRRWRPTVVTAAAVGIGLVMLVEYKATITMAERVDRPETIAVNRALSRLPDGPVVELPMGVPWQPEWAYIEAPRMVLSARDWNPRVNGYTGYTPRGYEETAAAFNSLADGPASPDALALLDRFGVRYLVLRLAPVERDPSRLGRSFYDEDTAARVVAGLPPERVEATSRHGAAILVRLRPPG